MVQGISFERFVVYIIFFITIFFVCISAGYLAQADQEGRNIRLVVQSTVPEAVVSHQPFGVWFHTGSDPLLGPFEESLDLMSIRTFRSEIHAPLFAEEPIIIRGFWRQEEDSMIGLYVSNFKVNEIRYDYDKQVFINTDGYWYARIGNRDALERIRAILISSPVSPADQQGAIDRS